MLLPDLINGIFETCGGFFIALSVIKLHREKVVKGVSWLHVAFFSSWGFWNLFFYPHLGQWFSFWGGLLLVAVNCVWLGQIAYYNWRNDERHLSRFVGGRIAPRYPAGGHVPEADQFGGFDRTSRFRHNDK